MIYLTDLEDLLFTIKQQFDYDFSNYWWQPKVMIRNLLLCVFFPSLVFSQDTLFNQKLDEVKIRSTQKKESNLAVINMVRNSSVISDGVSVEFIKKTPDRTVGDALKRINGVTIQNDKFVLVRGLSDRYNSAILNKTILPSLTKIVFL